MICNTAQTLPWDQLSPLAGQHNLQDTADPIPNYVRNCPCHPMNNLI